MRLGACVSTMDLSQLKAVKNAGFDYVEITLSDLYSIHDEKLMEFKNELSRVGIPCESANCFMPGSIKIVGKTVNYRRITDYLDVVLRRAGDLGIKTIVFGSGGARSREDDFPEAEAYNQAVTFLRDYAGPVCAQYGMEIAIEPLIYKATKMIHKLSEAAKLAGDCNRSNISVLADIYHMVNNGDDIDNILKYKGKIIHSHISEPDSRAYPLEYDNLDYKYFMSNLNAVGCKRCSIEAETKNFEYDIKAAFNVMSALNR